MCISRSIVQRYMPFTWLRVCTIYFQESFKEYVLYNVHFTVVLFHILFTSCFFLSFRCILCIVYNTLQTCMLYRNCVGSKIDLLFFHCNFGVVRLCFKFDYLMSLLSIQIFRLQSWMRSIKITDQFYTQYSPHYTYFS